MDRVKNMDGQQKLHQRTHIKYQVINKLINHHITQILIFSRVVLP